MSSALTIAPETTSLTLVTSKPASKSAAHRIALAIVWLTVASGFFVFSEPAPFDALTMGLIVLLPVIGLTRQTQWPIGLGVIDGDAIDILYWTGAISPIVHTNTVLGLRPDLFKSAMGRAWTVNRIETESAASKPRAVYCSIG
mgnify:CR=1 FL=1